MSRDTLRTPAVVVGGSLNALGVVRSLDAGDVPTLLLESTRRCPCGFSRHGRFVRAPSLEGRALVDELRALAERLGERPVLMLTDDRAVQTVSEARDQLEPHVRLRLPPRDVVPMLEDKARFQAFAESAGLPVPRTVVLRGPGDQARLVGLTPPLVIKPVSKARVLGSAIERAVRVETIADARAVVAERVDRAGGLVAQEWIDGADGDLHFTLFVCDRGGAITAYFQGRKVVCDPPRVGSTALCTEADDPTGELERVTRRYCARVGYVGVGGLELKRDRRSGRFVLVEPTVGRTDWQEEIATLSGVNIPLAAYRTALDQPCEPRAPRTGPVAWRSSWAHRAPPGELPPGVRLVDGYFRRTDPLPGIYHYGFERFAVRLWHLVSQPSRWVERVSRLGGLG
jgi:predicted ATP-grasp superfamily ATP-dependent carboligase